ncbi:MAG: hypothetical protein JWO45_298 [Spartobacteria bacterium]|nr:hypothetical protein [Spartobacteria bacterium]
MADPIPARYHTVSPYLIFKNAADALKFYARAFRGVETRRLLAPDQKIMHAEMKIGDSTIMLADEFPSHQALSPESVGGSPVSLVLHVAEVDVRVNEAICAGATLLRPVQDQFTGDRSGTVLDPFGYRWTVTTHIEDISDEEIDRRFTAMMSGNKNHGAADGKTHDG